MAHIIRNVLECHARQPFCGLENGWGPSQMFVAYTEHTLTVKSNFHFHFPRGELLHIGKVPQWVFLQLGSVFGPFQRPFDLSVGQAVENP